MDQTDWMDRAAPYNALTGFGCGYGLSADWGGGVSGWMDHEEFGCLDAPRCIAGGGMVRVDSGTHQQKPWRGME